MSSQNYLLLCVVPIAVLFVPTIVLVFAMCRAAGKADELAEKVMAEMEKGAEK